MGRAACIVIIVQGSILAWKMRVSKSLVTTDEFVAGKQIAGQSFVNSFVVKMRQNSVSNLA